ncbi:MAG: imidazole glycerol phosphate synthase subunit HisH [Gemmatimonadota bacterium]
MIALVDYGAGNLRSVEFALDRLGVAHRRARTPDDLGSARGVVLPGVGAAASAMAALTEAGWPDELRERRRPLLGVCLGMQLLCESSEENAGNGSVTECLGLVPGTVRRFGWDGPGRSDGPPVPHMGWSRVSCDASDPLFRDVGSDDWFYFLHTFRVDCPESVVSGTASYGETFPAALRSGNVAGVQFHPEKSERAGARMLANFCEECATC